MNYRTYGSAPVKYLLLHVPGPFLISKGAHKIMSNVTEREEITIKLEPADKEAYDAVQTMVQTLYSDDSSPDLTEANVPTSSMKIKRKRCMYTVETRLEGIAFAEKHGKRAAARHFNVARKTIRDWCHQKETLLKAQLEGKQKRKKLGMGRIPALPQLEDQLLSYVESERAAKRPVTRKQLFIKAEELYNAMKATGHVTNDESIGFSNGWLWRFMKRKNLIGSLALSETEEFDHEQPWTKEDSDHEQAWTKEDSGHEQPWTKEDSDHEQAWTKEDSGHEQAWTKEDSGHEQPWTKEDSDHEQAWTKEDSGHEEPWTKAEADHEQLWTKVEADHEQRWIKEEANHEQRWIKEEANREQCWIKEEANHEQRWIKEEANEAVVQDPTSVFQ